MSKTMLMMDVSFILWCFFFLSVTVKHVVIKGPIDLNDMSADYKHIEPHGDANSSICIILCNLSEHRWLHFVENCLRFWFHPSVIFLYPGFFFFSLMNISTSLLHIVHVVLTVCPVIFECIAFMDKRKCEKKNKNQEMNKKKISPIWAVYLKKRLSLHCWVQVTDKKRPLEEKKEANIIFPLTCWVCRPSARSPMQIHSWKITNNSL